jgi:hypothetical protein
MLAEGQSLVVIPQNLLLIGSDCWNVTLADWVWSKTCRLQGGDKRRQALSCQPVEWVKLTSPR